MSYNAPLVWTAIIAAALIAEAVGLIREWFFKQDDHWTLTHYLSYHIPPTFRAMIIGWLFYHFLIEHPKNN
jgi:hypothetical protein